LGTPVEAYDTEGKQIWSSELDGYGRVKESNGEKDFIPFRYQGQYEDVETGLYYNRFRYYSPSEGIYTQQDPIGLAGGNPTTYGFVGDPNVWVDPFGLSPRNKRGTASGVGKEISGKWLRGSHGNAGLIPNDIAEKLSGRSFANFDRFREAFWMEIANNPKYAKEFSAGNRARMNGGNAPIAHKTQWDGKVKSYTLHHRTPIMLGVECLTWIIY